MSKNFVYKVVIPEDNDPNVKLSYLRHGDWTTRYLVNEIAFPRTGTLLFCFSTIESAAQFAARRLRRERGKNGKRLPRAEVWLAYSTRPPVILPKVVKTISCGPHNTGSAENYINYWLGKVDPKAVQNAPHDNVGVSDIVLIADVTDAAYAIIDLDAVSNGEEDQ